jgi:curved DNA-binding protein CbpA
MKEDFEFMEKITRNLEARKAACENATREQLKKAYRRASMKYHPDHNPHDPDANKKFTLINCAYELLAEDKPYPKLLEEISTWEGVPEDDKYRLDNTWGHFLWWREKFFGSEEKKRQNKGRSCI